jgi:hypothetical protein
VRENERNKKNERTKERERERGRERKKKRDREREWQRERERVCEREREREKEREKERKKEREKKRGRKRKTGPPTQFTQKCQRTTPGVVVVSPIDLANSNLSSPFNINTASLPRKCLAATLPMAIIRFCASAATAVNSLRGSIEDARGCARDVNTLSAECMGHEE